MIRLKRSRDVASLHQSFTGDGLLAKLTALVEARMVSEQIDWKGVLGDWGKMKPFLRKDSFDKCAYCESSTASVAHGDVEHFRPKSVYWWLAFCVDNYVFACQLCNQTYKSDHFPIHGAPLQAPKLPKALPVSPVTLKRLIKKISPDPAVVDEATLLAAWTVEDADLPHPYLEDPEPFFAWKAVETNEEVFLIPPDNATPRAKRATQAAIDYLGLNRESLRKNRYAVYQLFALATQIWSLPGNSPAKAIALKQMHWMCRQDQQFAGMCRYLAHLAGVPPAA